MAKKRVLVLFGGRSSEHSISAVSVGNVLRAIDTDLYEPIPIGITREGEWISLERDPRDWGLQDLPEVKCGPETRPVIIDFSKHADGFYLGAPGTSAPDYWPENRQAGDSRPLDLQWLGHIDLVFPVLHGIGGEDGSVQGLCETLGVPYVGCGILASAIGIDKSFTKLVLKEAGIPVIPGVTVDTRRLDHESRFEASAKQILEKVEKGNLGWPVFVKPSNGGSSIGVAKADAPDDLAAAVWTAAQYDWKVLVERNVNARELACPVMQLNPMEEPRAAWPSEIVMDRKGKDSFYDFDAKFVDSSASHIESPAKVPMEYLRRVQELAVAAFKAVDGHGLMRVDCFITEEKKVVVNEINTMPGQTPRSFWPKAWEASGLPYASTINGLIASQLRWPRRDNRK